MNNSTQQEGRLRSAEDWQKIYDGLLKNNGRKSSATVLHDFVKEVIKYTKEIPPPTVSELKQKFAEHLGEKELNTTDAYAIEFAVKNI